MAKTTKCVWPGCDQPVAHGKARCKPHQKQFDANMRAPAKRVGGLKPRANGAKRREATESTRVDSVAEGETALAELPVDALRPSRIGAQASRRTRFDGDQLDELAANVRAVGVLQPLLVKPDGAEGFEIVAGERRWLAARKAGLATVPCIVRQWDDAQSAVVQLVENLQRQDIHALDEATGYGALREHGWDVDRLAAQIGRSRSHVYGRLQLLALSPACREALGAGEIAATAGRTLSRVLPSLQDAALDAVRLEQDRYDAPLTTREIEELIDEKFRRRIDGRASEIGFSPKDSSLVALGGDQDGVRRACTGCAWNTSHNRALGGRKGACANPACHADKQRQHADNMAAKFRGEVVYAKKVKAEFDYNGSAYPSQTRYVTGTEMHRVRVQAEETGATLPEPILFICRDPDRTGPRTHEVYRRADVEAALPPKRAENTWEAKRHQAVESVAQITQRAQGLLDGAEFWPHHVAHLERFLVAELRVRVYPTTIEDVATRWEGANDRAVPLDAICPDDAELRRFALDLLLTQARESADATRATAFAEACVMPNRRAD